MANRKFTKEFKDSTIQVALITGITGQDGSYLAELEFIGEGIDEKAYVVSCSNPEYQVEKRVQTRNISKWYDAVRS